MMPQTPIASAPPPPRPAQVYSPPAASAQPYVAPQAPAAVSSNAYGGHGTQVQTGTVDWESVIADLQQITEDQLGNRARKVKDLLGAADRSRSGIQSAIDQIPTISILFVDASRLEALANDLRARLEAYTQ